MPKKCCLAILLLLTLTLAACKAAPSPTPGEALTPVLSAAPDVSPTPTLVSEETPATTPQDAPSGNPEQADYETMYVKVGGTGLNVREKPEENAAQVAFVYPDDAVCVYEVKDEWAYISCTDREGGETKKGYVKTQYLVSELPRDASVPALPKNGAKLADFVPKGWYLLDSVELDFNADGKTDYVGVLAHSGMKDAEPPYDDKTLTRILFAVKSDGNKGYALDFQDDRLIRTAIEGGAFGDPYEPLTCKDNTFTTNAYGGSAWKWSDAYTYRYIKGIWYMVRSEETSAWMGFPMSEEIKDYEARAGTKSANSQELADDVMEDKIPIPDGYETTEDFEVGPPLTLQEFSKRQDR